MTFGTLYGIGLGPGDPELITLKGLRLLQRVERVFVAATAPDRSYALAIAAPHLEPGRQQIVPLVCPPLRDPAALRARWTELASDVAALQADGRDAVFLTEGDPSLYSTFLYLRDALRRNHPEVPVETVPGISSPSAAAALAGLPLAIGDEPLAIVPGTTAPAAIRSTFAAFPTTVLLKPARAVQIVPPTAEVALVRRAGRPEQRVAFGAEALALAGEDYFSTLIVRNAARGDDA